MSKSANVRSVQALKDFRVAMCNFAEDARGALGGVEMEIRKFRDWLERDQYGYWQMQVKRRHEEVMDARAALHKKKLSAGKSNNVSDSEEKENLRNAQRRLRVAEEKVELVRRLIPQLHQTIAAYHAHSQPLGDHMSGGFERSLSRLTAMIDAIEKYLALQAPSGSAPVASSVTSGGAAARPAPGTATRSADSRSAETATGSAAPAEPAAGEAASEPVGAGVGMSAGTPEPTIPQEAQP